MAKGDYPRLSHFDLIRLDLQRRRRSRRGALQQHRNLVGVNRTPCRRVFQKIRQRRSWFQQSFVDLVLVQDLEWLLDRRRLAMVIQYAFVHEDICASVNKRLQLGGIPLHVPTPHVLVEDPSLELLPLHELQRSRGILFVHQYVWGGYMEWNTP